MRRWFTRVLIGLVIFGPFALWDSGAQSPESEWRFYGGDAGGTRFSSLKQITQKNVHLLKRAWTYHTEELPEGKFAPAPSSHIMGFACTPLVVDGVMYIVTPSNRVIALEAETGREIWQYDPQAGKTRDRATLRHRGVAYWEGPSATGGGKDRRILYGTKDAQLVALDAATGELCRDFGRNGIVDLKEGMINPEYPGSYQVTSPPAIYKDLAIIGAAVPEGQPKGPSGDVRAFNVRTGKLVWRFHTVPRPGEFGNDSWGGDSWKDRTGVNVWSMMSVDTERGIVFLPTGSPSYDFYGGDRPGQNLFGNSVVALDAATGRRIWHYQVVHHDIWDYDLPAQPVLVTVNRNGGRIPAVAQVTKQSFIFVLNRLTGEPLFPVEERPVPKSTVPGEATWPTQPFPLKPPPLSRLNITRDDLSAVTPESKKYCQELFEKLATGPIYTPPGFKPMLQITGTLGGNTWAGAAFDPTTGYLYANANELASFAEVVPTDKDHPLPFRRGGRYGEYGKFTDEDGYSCLSPPWGTLNAVDLNSGEMVWRVPLGEVEELKARGVPRTGTLTVGGPIVTAGGLVFIGATTDNKFRAFDSRTGKVLWEAKLEAGGFATPMTFLGKKTGKQYVVIAAGGGSWFSKTRGDALIAFALP